MFAYVPADTDTTTTTELFANAALLSSRAHETGEVFDSNSSSSSSGSNSSGGGESDSTAPKSMVLDEVALSNLEVGNRRICSVSLRVL